MSLARPGGARDDSESEMEQSGDDDISMAEPDSNNNGNRNADADKVEPVLPLPFWCYTAPGPSADGDGESHDDVTPGQGQGQLQKATDFVSGGSSPEDWRKAFQEFIQHEGSFIASLNLDSAMETELSIGELRKLVFQQLPALVEFSLQTSKKDHLRPLNHPSTPSESELIVAPLPKLQRIKIFSPDPTHTPQIDQFVVDVIAAAKNLKYISVPYVCGKLVDKILVSLLHPRLVSSERDSIGLHLNHIGMLKTLKLAITGTDLRNLVQLGQRFDLHLDELFMLISCERGSRLDERQEMTLLFKQFLVTQARTLRKLGLSFGHFPVGKTSLTQEAQNEQQTELKWNNFGPAFRVPVMDKLVTFKVTRFEHGMEVGLEFEGKTGGGGTKHENLGIACPSLSRFVYHHHENPHLFRRTYINLREDRKQMSHDGVSKLEITATPKNLIDLGPALLFPAVTDFQVTIASTTPAYCRLMKVWSMWPALTKLKIIMTFGPTLSMDELLSGVDPTLAKGLLKKLDLKPSSPVDMVLADLRHLADQYKKKPSSRSSSIRDLHQLQEFTLEPQGGSSGSLTDIGVLLGLALAGPQLKRVTLQGPCWNSPTMKNETGEQCRGFLQRVLGPDAVISM